MFQLAGRNHLQKLIWIIYIFLPYTGSVLNDVSLTKTFIRKICIEQEPKKYKFHYKKKLTYNNDFFSGSN